MAAGTYDFVLEQGTTHVRTVRVPLDLTGYTARMQVKPKHGQPAVISLTTETEGLTIVPSADPLVTPSEVRWHIPPEQSSPLTIKRGVYDLELVASDGRVIRLLEGKVTISPEVTT